MNTKTPGVQSDTTPDKKNRSQKKSLQSTSLNKGQIIPQQDTPSSSNYSDQEPLRNQKESTNNPLNTDTREFTGSNTYPDMSQADYSEYSENFIPQYEDQQFMPQYADQYAEPFFPQPFSVDAPEFDLKYYQYIHDFPRASDYNSWESICETFPHLKNVNAKNFDTENIKECRAFIMRSNNEDDVHKSIKYGIWTSSPRNNEMLNKLFLECYPRNVPIFLFYSVVKSGQFVGVAQMMSSVQETSSNLWWEGDKWLNQFETKWIFVKDVSYKCFSQIMIDGAPVSRAKDCTAVPSDTAFEMLRVYKGRPTLPNIFSAFEYMDYREDYLRCYKASLAQMELERNYFNQFLQYSAPTGPVEGKKTKDSGHQYFKYNSFPYESAQQVKKQTESTLKPEDWGIKMEELEKSLSKCEEKLTKLLQNSEEHKEALDIKKAEKEVQEGIEDLESKLNPFKKLVADKGGDSKAQSDLDKKKQSLKKMTDKIEALKKKFRESGFKTSSKLKARY